MLTEHEEQVLVIEYCDLKNITVFAIPNGSNKSKASANKFKKEGLRSGVPDLMIPVARQGAFGLFIKMKRSKSTPSQLSDNQRKWIKILDSEGYAVHICNGFEDAKIVIDNYFKQTHEVYQG